MSIDYSKLLIYNSGMENTASPFQTPQDSTYVSPQKPSIKIGRWIIAVIILAMLIGGGVKLWGLRSGQTSENLAPTPSPTEFQFPTNTPAPTGSSETVTPSPSPKPTANPIDKTTGLDRSTLSVEVQNGSGVAGAAGKASDVLKGFGYNVVATGNAGNFDYENVTVQVKSAKSDFLALLKKDLGFSYTVGSTSADLSSDSSADALVIIGK